MELPGKKNKIFIFFILIIFGYTSLHSKIDKELKLKYDVSIDAVIIPLFAHKKNGNPVYDLKKEDLELYVNGEKIDINFLTSYLLTSEGDSGSEQKKESGLSGSEIKGSARNIFFFLIIDSVFNSRDGFRRSKNIAKKLIKGGKKEFKYIVIEINPIAGLRYIGGPEMEQDELIKRIDEMKLNFNRWSRRLFRQKTFDGNLNNDMHDPSNQQTKRFLDLSKLNSDMDRYYYRNYINKFSSMLSRFKYALKVITRPKIACLISEGIARGGLLADLGGFSKVDIDEQDRISEFKRSTRGTGQKFQQWSVLFDSERKDNFKLLFSGLMLGYLKDIARAINMGNSVLFTINPAKPDDGVDKNSSGEMSLKYLSAESGGSYFTGSSVNKIVERIKNDTTAYYELSFLLPKDFKGNLDIRIVSKKKNVFVKTIRHTELNKKYSEMNTLQKKIFAYNLARGGNWSRLISNIYQGGIVVKKSMQFESIFYSIRFPQIFVGKISDIFIISEEQETKKVDIKKLKIRAKLNFNMKLKNSLNKIYYLVIIENSGVKPMAAVAALN